LGYPSHRLFHRRNCSFATPQVYIG
jgi:hypothetical protein